MNGTKGKPKESNLIRDKENPSFGYKTSDQGASCSKKSIASTEGTD